MKETTHQCAQIHTPETDNQKHYLQNELTHVPSSRDYCCYFVVLFSFVFFLSLPQSTWSCWLLPRSSWACSAAAALLLEEFSQMPECQEGRSRAWWFLPAAQHSSLLPLFFKLRWLNPFFFSNKGLRCQSIRQGSKSDLRLNLSMNYCQQCIILLLRYTATVLKLQVPMCNSTTLSKWTIGCLAIKNIGIKISRATESNIIWFGIASHSKLCFIYQYSKIQKSGGSEPINTTRLTAEETQKGCSTFWLYPALYTDI